MPQPPTKDDYSILDDSAYEVIPDPNESRTWLDELVDYGKGVWTNINPVPGIIGTARAMVTPPTTTGEKVASMAGPVGLGAARIVPKLLEEQGKLATKAKAAFDKGDYVTGVRHALDYILPLVGPPIDRSIDKMADGKFAEGAGEFTGLAGSLALPGIISKNPRLTPALTPTAEAADVAAFAAKRGIPIDAATATGNGIVDLARNISDETIAGSAAARTFGARQREPMVDAGRAIAKDATGVANIPGASRGISASESAGTRLFNSGNYKIKKLNALAKEKFDAVRSAVPISVDLEPTRAAMQSVFEHLSEESKIAPLTGSKARAFNALKTLMSSEETNANLVDVNSVVSDLRGALRGTDAETRSAGEGIFAKLANKLDTDLRQAATQAGPDVLKALEEGRAAVKLKHQVEDAVEEFGTEPVTAFNKATMADDHGIGRLRDLAEVVPDALPHIGRAWIDNAVDMISKGRAGDAVAAWGKLGPSTRKLLIKNRQYESELDKLFTLAKQSQSTSRPNTVLGLGQAGWMYLEPHTGVTTQLAGGLVSSLMRSSAGVRALTNGFRIPAASKVATAAWLTQLRDVASNTANQPDDDSGYSVQELR